MPLMPIVSRPHWAGMLLAACLAAALLSGCGDKKDGKTASQVLAKVNGDEISVHQLNHVLARQPKLANAPEAVRKQVLDKLIDRQLAYQQAMKDELDRTPEVMMAIEEAKYDIIAGAYLRKLSAGQAAPSREEAEKYFNDHPDLFAKRKIYRLRELALPNGLPQAADVKTAVAQGQSLDAIAASLKAQNVPFQARIAVQAAEQLPIDALARLGAAGNGQMVMYEGPQTLSLYQVLESQARPVDLTAALPKINEYLAAQQAAKAASAEMKRLRETAKIEYVGELGQPAEAAAPAPAASPAPAPAPATPDSALSHDEAAKGVAGLK
ncbi:peptidyl-prolyl cis-trans isomerase, EpsD family [Parasulfuritortus cantonensis]|uniref:peptidylprolyl isomerase n=1 Tax=Parasulfuritortus cantonensis TaxID=2528202 RepID=A0A4R1BL09_9PROT|nr:EpsD family peptidyl-prolyl cis-trans isomerase [Parasulfuritortus cantonensis]TCJ17928.1 peptidyl-prolyl cis-trans isomerase, EpsD family [Parasulfuritortus cantonensis]